MSDTTEAIQNESELLERKTRYLPLQGALEGASSSSEKSSHFRYGFPLQLVKHRIRFGPPAFCSASAFADQYVMPISRYIVRQAHDERCLDGYAHAREGLRH